MIIAVMSTGTVVFAQRIAYRIIRGGDAVDQSFLQKGLQSAVYRDPVESLTGLFLYIAMRKRTILLEKKLQDLPPATGDAQLIFFQDLVYLFFHLVINRGYC